MVDVQVRLWMLDRDISALLVTESALEPSSSLNFVLLCMEWSMHGVTWLIASVVTLMLAIRFRMSLETTYKFAVLFLGVCADLVLVGILKVLVRRVRPHYNRDDMVLGTPYVDRFSFPSGHTSRTAMLAVLGMSLCSPPVYLSVLIKCYPFAVGISRLMLGRHYLSDVIGALILGWLEGKAVILLPYNTALLLQRTFPFSLVSA